MQGPKGGNMAPPAFSDKVRCFCCKVPLPQACCGVGCAAGIFASLTAVAGLAGLATGTSSCIYMQPGDKNGSSLSKVSYTVGYMVQKTVHYLVLALYNVGGLARHSSECAVETNWGTY